MIKPKTKSCMISRARFSMGFWRCTRQMSHLMDEPVARGWTKGDPSHHPQVTPEGVSRKDVVEVQPLTGSALTKLIRSLRSFHRPNCRPCKRRERRICLLIVKSGRSDACRPRDMLENGAQRQARGCSHIHERSSLYQR